MGHPGLKPGVLQGAAVRRLPDPSTPRSVRDGTRVPSDGSARLERRDDLYICVIDRSSRQRSPGSDAIVRRRAAIAKVAYRNGFFPNIHRVSTHLPKRIANVRHKKTNKHIDHC